MPAHRARLLAVWLLYLLQGSVASPDGPKDFRQKFKVGMEDVVVSMPVDQKHLTVARGSRAWRKVRCAALPQACHCCWHASRVYH